MHVLVTGGTGFVGYHTARALLSAGHDVTLLVRSLDKAHQLFGSDQLQRVVRGDINDADSVRRALRGCDALVHSAAVVSTSRKDAGQVFERNTNGTRTVIQAGLDANLQALIYVSSVTALFDEHARTLNEHSPPGPESHRGAYGRSKVAGEIYARSMQDDGAPVYITYPGSVVGPEDPGLTEPHKGLIGLMYGIAPQMPSGNQYIDVRDLAEAHLRILEQLPSGKRFPMGGTFLPWRDHGKLLATLTGRRFLPLPVLPGVPLLAGALLDRLSQVLTLELPITEEGMRYATRWVQLDDSHTLKTLDLQYRPLAETFEAALLSLHATGHLSQRQLGRLAQH
ncbi:SDR family NAD(P)-dependent oxidoreductase [Parahaliea mediterranea]|uniref:SDR family NAD(P)-dependent oxidoreductase n=1 Tax=Parahaliea mediterranea TaxID=651086 RepID=UPI000E2E5AD5|nr:SDR family NAD(P)-dependent oxidoreductase [Parahaliea mediterranea]